MRFLRSLSIRVHLLLLAAAAMLPGMAIVWYTGAELRQAAINDAKDLSLRLVESMAAEQERMVESTRLMLTTLALVPEVRRVEKEAVSRLLADLLKELPNYATLALATPEGTVVSSSVPVEPYKVEDRKYFRDALSSRGFAVGEYATSRSTKRSVLHFGTPVVGFDGQVAGVLIAAFDLAAFGRVFAAIDLPEGSVLSLTDQRGIRLFRYPGNDNYAGAQDIPDMLALQRASPSRGTLVTRGEDGVERLYGYQRLLIKGADSYAFLRIGIPLDQALSEAHAVMRRNLTMLALAAVLALISAWALGEVMIVRRLDGLVESARLLGSGEMSVRTGLNVKEGEFGKLGAAFDHMAESLENREEERQQALAAIRLSEEKFRGIFENAVEGLYQTTISGRFLAANPALAVMLGYPSPQAMTCAVTDIRKQIYVDPLAREEILDILSKRGFVTGYETRFRRADGSPIWVMINARLIRGQAGEEDRIDGSIVDITGRKDAEETIRRLNEDLEARVALRTYQLEGANTDLKETLEHLRAAQSHLVQTEKMAALGGLVAGVAHEINTPVGIAVTAASHLEQKTQELSAAVAGAGLTKSALTAYLDLCRESAVMILSNLRRAAELIRSFKQVAVDQSSEARRSFNLYDYIEEVLLSLRPKLKKTPHAITVTCDPGLVVDSYPGALSQIITNLVMNSLIHAYAEGEAGRLTLHVERRQDKLVITYSDDGRGIPKEFKDKIFEPFFTTSRHKGGTGLGLNILYNVVTRTLGGAISCASEPGKGATFTIVVPLSEDTPASPAA